ncbi:MAG: hypothetical protein WDM81_13670 [Rhizomicrobium sp.]
MSLCDHLMMFDSEAAALAALPQHVVPSDDGPLWNPGYAMSVDVTLPDPSGAVDDAGEPVRVPMEKSFVWISLPALDATLRDMPDNACRLIADRDAANAGETFLIYRASDLDDATMAAARIAPVYAGTNYPFG